MFASISSQYLLQSRWVQLDMATAAGGSSSSGSSSSNEGASSNSSNSGGEGSKDGGSSSSGSGGGGGRRQAHVLQFTPVGNSRYVSDRPHQQQVRR